ncbi:MAG: isoprenylcysteine carboxylmethyltransferase family protein [Rhizomicrobium sp.]
MNSFTASPDENASSSAPWFTGAKVYDLLAASPLILWYAFCVIQQVPQLLDELASIWVREQQFLPIIDLLSKFSVFLFTAVLIGLLVARRTPSAKAQGFFPRIAAFLGCYLGVAILVLPRHPVGWAVEVASTAFILGGMTFALYGLLWLGRSISIMSEARQLVIGGPYGLVRHPLYLGEQLALVGVSLQYMSPVALALLALQFSFQLYRMGFEEQVLSENFPEYEAYKARTARLIPGVY